MVLFAVGEKYEGLQKRVSRNEVAELSEAELIGLVHLQLGTPRSKRVDPKGLWTRRLYPHSDELLLIKEGTEIRLSCSKDFEEEIVWWAFIEFDMPGKVIRAEWDSSSSLVKIYDETYSQSNLRAKHTKFFLLQDTFPLTSDCTCVENFILK